MVEGRHTQVLLADGPHPGVVKVLTLKSDGGTKTRFYQPFNKNRHAVFLSDF